MSENDTTITLEEARQKESKTDWERLEHLTDEEIRESADEDPDQFLLDDEWFEDAEFVMPSSAKERITIRLDEDVLEFFRAGGSSYQSRINKVLREYMAIQRYKARHGEQEKK